MREEIINRAMEIGNEFTAWNIETGPCPICIVDTSSPWGKRLCVLFERIAELEVLAEEQSQFMCFGCAKYSSDCNACSAAETHNKYRNIMMKKGGE